MGVSAFGDQAAAKTTQNTGAQHTNTHTNTHTHTHTHTHAWTPRKEETHGHTD
mgnify:CR=1 FL=1